MGFLIHFMAPGAEEIPRGVAAKSLEALTKGVVLLKLCAGHRKMSLELLERRSGPENQPKAI